MKLNFRAQAYCPKCDYCIGMVLYMVRGEKVRLAKFFPAFKRCRCGKVLSS